MTSALLQFLLMLAFAVVLFLAVCVLVRVIIGPDSITDTDDFYAGHARPNTGSDE